MHNPSKALKASRQAHDDARRHQPPSGYRGGLSFWTALLLLTVFPGSLQAQAGGQPVSAPGAAPNSAIEGAEISPSAAIGSNPTAKLDSAQHNSWQQRRAAKVYLAASKLFEKGKFEAAMRGYERAATLDPGNSDYPLAVIVARNHVVMALIQAAARDRARGDAAAAGAALDRAYKLDPTNAQVGEHLNQMGDAALSGQSISLYEQGAETAGEEEDLAPSSGVRSFHLHTGQRQIIMEVFKSFGLEATVDDSVTPVLARLDLDNVDFATAARVLGLATDTFYVQIDAHSVLVARDTRENRTKFMREEVETVYLSGLTLEQLSNMANMARNIFNARKAAVDASSGTITLRAPERTLDAFNSTVSELLDGQSQVLLEVRLIQLAHTSQRNTGVQPPQTISAYNVYSEEQSILNANQALVQQIISSGLAAPGDTLTILGILLASGQVSSSLFSNGVALFGGGLTQSALAPGGATFNLNLNSSDTRELDQIQLRLGDGEDATIKSGSRYPIQTAEYSNPSSSLAGLAGLTSAGTSGALSSLLASYSSAVNIPQIQYQDLGLTLKATPKLMRNGDVALTLDMKIDALSGSSLNGNPILDTRAYSGVVTLKVGEAAVVASEMDKSESLAVSGTPGISEIPGLNNVSANNGQKNYATLLMVITAHVIRGAQAAGHSPMMRVEKEDAGQN